MASKRSVESMDVPFKNKQVKLAVSALLAYLNEQQTNIKETDVLFEPDEYLSLLVGFRKIPQTNGKPSKIPLPHSLNSNSEVCLISKEPGKVLKEKFADKGVTCVTKVISLTKLRKEYKTFMLKRQLASSYDLFLCDERILPLANKTLGKAFSKRKKEPIPVRLTYQDWNSEINKSLSCSLLRMGHGSCSNVKIGVLGVHTEKELIENVIHAMKVCARKIPGQWKNVKSMYIKSATSVALPVYQASPLDVVQIPVDVKEKTKRKKKRKVLKPTKDDNDTELSTTPDNVVPDNDNETEPSTELSPEETYHTDEAVTADSHIVANESSTKVKRKRKAVKIIVEDEENVPDSEEEEKRVTRKKKNGVKGNNTKGLQEEIKTKTVKKHADQKKGEGKENSTKQKTSNRKTTAKKMKKSKE